jgi:hypothetical protein
MIARINAMKRSAYSAGGTGLILCYIQKRKATFNPCTRQEREERNEMYPICRHALPQMLDSLHDAIRRQYIDDAKVIHRIEERLVLFISRTEPALVLEKKELLSIARVFLR